MWSTGRSAGLAEALSIAPAPSLSTTTLHSAGSTAYQDMHDIAPVQIDVQTWRPQLLRTHWPWAHSMAIMLTQGTPSITRARRWRSGRNRSEQWTNERRR